MEVMYSEDVDLALNAPLVDTAAQQIDFNRLWEEVASRCKKIMQWESSPELQNSQNVVDTIMQAYTLVYHLVSHKCKGTPALSIKGSRVPHGEQIVIVHSRFHDLLEEHLRTNVLTTLCSSSLMEPSTCVQTYIRQWRAFLAVTCNLKTIFSSLSSTWMALGYEDNPFDRTEDVAQDKWTEIVVTQDIQASLRSEIRDLITMDRAGTGKPGGLSFVAEIKDELTMLRNPDVYTAVIEEDYLRDMCDFYREKVAVTREHGLRDYVVECVDDLRTEKSRASRCMTGTRSAMHWLTKIFVDEQHEYFESHGLKEVIGNWNTPQSQQTLKLWYTLVSRSRCRGLDFLEKYFAECVKNAVRNAIRHALVSSSHGISYDEVIPCLYTLGIKLKCVVMDVFNGDCYMLDAMESGVSSGLLESDVKNFTDLAERLAVKFTEVIQLTPNDNECRNLIGYHVSVFHFLPDLAKDIFWNSYQFKLRQRLISEDINAWRENISLDFLARVQSNPTLFSCRSMMRDAASRRIFSCETEFHGAKWRPVVINGGTWRCPPSPAMEVSYPSEVQSMVDHALQYCKRNITGRKVEFSHAQSFGYARMEVSHLNGQVIARTRLRLTLLQLSVAQLFARQRRWSIGGICDELKVCTDDAENAIEPFVAASILSRSNLGLEIVTQTQAERAAFSLIPKVGGPAANYDVAEKLAEKQFDSTNPSNQAIESRVVQALKENGPLTSQQIRSFVTEAFAAPHLDRTSLVKCVEKLMERGMIDRKGQKFVFCP